MRAHVRENFIGIEEIGGIAAVVAKGTDERRNIADRDDVVAKTFLIMGGKVDEVKSPHCTIIAPPLVRPKYTRFTWYSKRPDVLRSWK